MQVASKFVWTNEIVFKKNKRLPHLSASVSFNYDGRSEFNKKKIFFKWPMHSLELTF